MILVIGVLATFGLVKGLIDSAGPYNIIAKLRSNRHMIDFGLFECAICLSFWIAALIAVIPSHSLESYILNLLSYAGGAILLYTLTERAV